MNTMQVSKREIIEKIVEVYSDDKNRSVYKQCREGTCQYRSDDGKVCAVGLFMKPEALDQHGSSTKKIAVLSMRHGLDNLIKEEYQGYNVSFWTKVQSLHDKEEYWSDCGITQEGLNYIKREIGVNL